MKCMTSLYLQTYCAKILKQTKFTTSTKPKNTPKHTSVDPNKILINHDKQMPKLFDKLSLDNENLATPKATPKADKSRLNLNFETDARIPSESLAIEKLKLNLDKLE